MSRTTSSMSVTSSAARGPRHSDGASKLARPQVEPSGARRARRRPSCARPPRPPTASRRGGPARPWRPGRRAACCRRGRARCCRASGSSPRRSRCWAAGSARPTRTRRSATGSPTARPGPWLAAARACAASSRESSCWARRRDATVLLSAARRAARACASAARRACSAAVMRASAVALAAHRGGLLALARLERREDALVVAGVVAPAAHGVDDQGVAALHAPQELDALEHVGEALRVEDDRDDVGLVGRVALAQHGGQRAAALGQPRAQAHEALARDAQLALGLGQARLPAREVALRLGQAPGHDVDRARRRRAPGAPGAPRPRRAGARGPSGGRCGGAALRGPARARVASPRRPLRRASRSDDGDRRRMACRKSAAAHENGGTADRRGPVRAGDASDAGARRHACTASCGVRTYPSGPAVGARPPGFYRLAEAPTGAQRRCSQA